MISGVVPDWIATRILSWRPAETVFWTSIVMFGLSFMNLAASVSLRGVVEVGSPQVTVAFLLAARRSRFAQRPVVRVRAHISRTRFLPSCLLLGNRMFNSGPELPIVKSSRLSAVHGRASRSHFLRRARSQRACP